MKYIEALKINYAQVRDFFNNFVLKRLILIMIINNNNINNKYDNNTIIRIIQHKQQ